MNKRRRVEENVLEPKNPCLEAYRIINEMIRTIDFYTTKYVQSSYECEMLSEENKRLSEELRLTKQQIQDLEDKYNVEKEKSIAREQEMSLWNKDIGISNEKESEMNVFIWELISISDRLYYEIDIQKKALSKQKIQLSYVQSQNERYQKAINRVTNTWYGKILKKVYHFFTRSKIG